MKLLTREFTTKEKVLLAVLVVVILALCYYQFIYVPIKDQIADANANADNLEMQLVIKEAQLEELRGMQAELETFEEDGTVSYMASYNNAKGEISFLNDALSDTLTYNLSIADVTREGDQIRRNISLEFTVATYAQAEQIIKALEGCENRCLLSDVQVSCAGNDLAAETGTVTVTATATFYETTVGGTADAGLPEDTAAAVDEAAEEAEE